MKIEEFLERLEGVQKSSGGWIARCPAHGDSNPSLSVSESGNRILVHCHAGCKPDEIVAAMGLKMKDLFTDSLADHRSAITTDFEERGDGGAAERAALGTGELSIRPADDDPDARQKKKSGKRPARKWICEYIYRNVDGSVAYKIDRFLILEGKRAGEKDMLHMRPDPESKFGWSYGLGNAGIKRLPYRLDRIVKASEKGRQIIIVEGEKDVESVEKAIGMVATTNSGGAGNWGHHWPENWIDWFKGSSGILIIADKDPEFKRDKKTGEMKPCWVGQKHAWDVRRQLIAAGFDKPIKLMVMPDVDGQKPVKDFTDWVEARTAAGLSADRAAFAEALKTVEEWPEEWEFDDATLTAAAKSGAPASKSGRAALSDEQGAWRPAGRFGCRSPRSPSQKKRWYLVDFHINSKKIARLEIGVDHFKFEGWLKNDQDELVRVQDWSPMKGELSQFFGMAIGCMIAWDEHFRIGNAQRYALASSIVCAWFRARGRFFADKNNPSYETSLFFDDDSGILYRLRSNEFSSFMATIANVNRKDKLFEYMISLLDDLAMNEEITPRVVPSKQWDRRGDAIYISNGDSKMCKITAGKYENVLNGTDGVVFVRGATLAPWKVENGPGVDPFVESLLFKHAALEKESDRMNCRLWFLNLFACHINKPILLLTGPARSGKTRLLQGMKQFLGMRDDGEPDDSVNDIDPTDKGLDAFWVIVDKGRFEIFDNYDTKIKWAENALQTAATNGSSKRRELYKTVNVVTLRSNSYIGLTSNNPVFTTEGGGLPDRIITARIGAGRKVSMGGELLIDIQKHRDSYMTWIVRTLAAVLADDKPVEESINKRHPDYGIFAVKCGRALGDESRVIRSMFEAELDKALLPLMNDIILKEVVAVLMAQTPPASLRFRSSDMSDMIIKKLGDDESDEKTKTIYGARRVGKAISRMDRELKTLFKWSSSLIEGCTRYEVSGLTAQGEAAFDPRRGVLEGFKGLSAESPLVGSGGAEFSETNPTNPPNPPYARAQAQNDLFPNREGEIEDYEDLEF